MHIGLIGKARSGKDSAAAHLVAARGYTRLAFADPLKAMALRVNPWITYDDDVLLGISAIRLSEVVRLIGWEHAKDGFPEVRRILQHIGQAQRELDADYWLRILLRSAAAIGGPVVVSDVRYLNEALAIRAAGFTLVRIVRPPVPLTAGQIIRAPKPVPATAAHVSETELDTFAADVEISNRGALVDLHRQIARVLDTY